MYNEKKKKKSDLLTREIYNTDTEVILHERGTQKGIYKNRFKYKTI